MLNNFSKALRAGVISAVALSGGDYVLAEEPLPAPAAAAEMPTETPAAPAANLRQKEDKFEAILHEPKAQRFEEALRKGEKLGSSDVAYFFEDIARTGFSTISGPFVKALYEGVDHSRLNERSRMRLVEATTELLMSKNCLTPAPELIRTFLKDSNPSVVAFAIWVIADRPLYPITWEEIEPQYKRSKIVSQPAVSTLLCQRTDLPIPEAVFRKFTEERMFDQERLMWIAYHRTPPGYEEPVKKVIVEGHGAGKSVALEIAKRDRSVLDKLSLLEIVQSAFKHNANGMGDEVRLAELLGKKIAHRTFQGSNADLESAVMHLLERIEETHPGYLKLLAENAPEALEEFVLSCFRVVSDARGAAITENPVLLSPESRIVALFHGDARFQADDIDPLASRFDVQQVKKLKPTEAAMIEETKTEFLESLEQLAADRRTKAMVVLSGHGDHYNFFLRDGRPDDPFTDDLILPYAVNYREIARCLVEGVSKKSEEPIEPIDLSHLTLVLDACFQADLARNLQTEIEFQAAVRNSEVARWPIIICAAQPRMYSYGRDVEMAEPIKSLLLEQMYKSVRREARTLTLADVYDSDVTLRSQLLKSLPAAALNDSLWLRNGRIDPVIFGTTPQRIEDLFGKIVRETERRTDMKLPKPSEQKPPESPLGPIEVGEVARPHVYRHS